MAAPSILRALFLLVALCSMSATASTTGKSAGRYQFAPRASWVRVARPEYGASPPAGQVSDGSWALMLDRQINVTAKGDEEYNHVAYAIINESGVESMSQIDFDVDPAYETLIINSIQVVRNGVPIDQRRTARIAALPREKQLEEHVYDGRYDINVVLSDVRVGDVIEYEYTVRSIEQLFPGHFSSRMSVGWSEPVRWQRVRLRYPTNLTLRYRFTSGEIAPEHRGDGDHQELLFQWENLAPIRADDDRPRWYNPWPILEISDFTDWSQPARLISPLYHVDNRSRPTLDAAAASLLQANKSKEESVMSALRLVQGTVRYTSISLGRGGFIPTDPETVLRRRFGDCKDKSLLLATLLNRLGIDAQPVLVNTRRGTQLPQSLPTPYAFDHAIVRVHLGKATYWLDSTNFKQYSPLASLERPDYAYALSLDPNTQGLETIESPDPQSRLREIHATIDARKGLLEPASFDVTTRYSGAAADDMRANLSDTSQAQLSKNYLDYYASHYASIKSAAPLSVDDDTDTNVLSIHEHYLIDKPFTRNDKKELTLSLYTDELYNFGKPLQSAARTSPLALPYPAHVKKAISVLLPVDWRLSDETTKVDDPAFRYRSSTRYENRILTLSYESEALADHVDASEIPAYRANRKRFYDDLDYHLTQDDAPQASSGKAADEPLALAPAPFLVALFSLGLGVWLMRHYVYHFDPAPRVATSGAPSGIGGWLVLPAIAVLGRPVVLGYLVGEWARFFDAKTWQGFPRVVAAPYGPLAQPVYLCLVALACLILPFTITVAILFFRKRTSVPLLFSAMLAILLAYDTTLLASLAAAKIDKSINSAEVWTQGLRSFAATLLWSLYMLKSERVKSTFTRRLNTTNAISTLPLPTGAE